MLLRRWSNPLFVAGQIPLFTGKSAFFFLVNSPSLLVKITIFTDQISFFLLVKIPKIAAEITMMT